MNVQPMIKEAETEISVNEIMKNAAEAFLQYKKTDPGKRAAFLEVIAEEINMIREDLVVTANRETNLPSARLNGEINRTINQLKMFASLIKEGSWVEASIDTAVTNTVPAKPDIRKMLVPIGPVIVFGASNFPFAFSTAGGDTASALASGSSVVVKGHSAHAETSVLVFSAIQNAIQKSNVPTHTVQHLLGPGNTVGKALVKHPLSKAVGFTGSFSGGKALVAYADEREIPIPVFAEMSSINPVVLYPDALFQNAENLATQFASSIVLGVGQFCTNPGIFFGVKSNGLDQFIEKLGSEITQVQPGKMLHDGICASYKKSLAEMLDQNGVKVIGQSAKDANTGEAVALVAAITAAAFLKNKHLTDEVFGPYSLVVVCEDLYQLKQCLQQLKGQLTSTIIATDKDVAEHVEIIDMQYELAGRILLNNVPTGVEVCTSMVHGGPYPATTDARFTSVGTSAIKRWVRPICLQNFIQSMLPDELKNENSLNIFRIVNNQHTRDAIIP